MYVPSSSNGNGADTHLKLKLYKQISSEAKHFSVYNQVVEKKSGRKKEGIYMNFKQEVNDNIMFTQTYTHQKTTGMFNPAIFCMCLKLNGSCRLLSFIDLFRLYL